MGETSGYFWMLPTALILLGVTLGAVAAVGGRVNGLGFVVPGELSRTRQKLVAVVGGVAFGTGALIVIAAFVLAVTGGRAGGAEQAGPAPRPDGVVAPPQPSSSPSPSPETGNTRPMPTIAPPPDGSAPGAVAPCDELVVRVTPLGRSDGKATFRVVIVNRGERDVEMPPPNGLSLVGSDGMQWEERLGDNYDWELGPEVAGGAQVTRNFVFRAKGRATTGTLRIKGIRLSSDPFETCDMTLRGVQLPQP